MNVSQLRTDLEFVEVQDEYNDGPFTDGYTSDLLSDVMGNAPEGAVLVTIQAHKNTVAVAALVGMPAIVLCNERPVPDAMIEAAKAEGIALFSTKLSQFRASVLIGKLLDP